MTYGCVIVGCCIIPIIVSIDEGIRVLETAITEIKCTSCETIDNSTCSAAVVNYMMMIFAGVYERLVTS